MFSCFVENSLDDADKKTVGHLGVLLHITRLAVNYEEDALGHCHRVAIDLSQIQIFDLFAFNIHARAIKFLFSRVNNCVESDREHGVQHFFAAHFSAFNRAVKVLHNLVLLRDSNRGVRKRCFTGVDKFVTFQITQLNQSEHEVVVLQAIIDQVVSNLDLVLSVQNFVFHFEQLKSVQVVNDADCALQLQTLCLHSH